MHDLEIGDEQLNVVGVGGVGCRIANNLPPFPRVKYTAIDVNEQPRDGDNGVPRLHLKLDATGSYLKQSLLSPLCDITIVTAALGGETGTTAAPIIAQFHRNHYHYVIGVVTTPLTAGKTDYLVLEGLRQLRESTDMLIVIDCDCLMPSVSANQEVSVYASADLLVSQCIEALVNLTIGTGILNVALKDFRWLVNPGHIATVGVGVGLAEGRDSIDQAVQMALQGPLTAGQIGKASCVLVTVNYGGHLFDVIGPLEQLGQLANPETAIIYNIFPVNSNSQDGCTVTIILAGLEE